MANRSLKSGLSIERGPAAIEPLLAWMSTTNCPHFNSLADSKHPISLELLHCVYGVRSEREGWRERDKKGGGRGREGKLRGGEGGEGMKEGGREGGRGGGRGGEGREGGRGGERGREEGAHASELAPGRWPAAQRQSE